jgi:hypothetical protein
MMEITTPAEETAKPDLITRILCTFISVVLHPIFIPIYVTAFLLYLHPTAFIGFSPENKNWTLVIVTINVTVFPLLSVLLLRALKFIDSILLKTQKDRIIPYIASGIFFFWTYTVFKQQPAYPLVVSAFLMGLFLSSSGALLANIYLKISMHGIAMGNWLGFFLMLMYSDSMRMTWPLFYVIILTGLVGTARLMLNSHKPRELYMGIALGMLSAVIGYYFVAG